jgi:hypothetical protein
MSAAPPRSAPRLADWPLAGLLLALALAITLILYGRSLRLPFYSDDLLQLPWLRNLTPGQLWTQASPYHYYRPLAYSLWLALGRPFTPSKLRLLNLALHALAAALAGLLAADLQPDRRRTAAGLIATGLFTAYPFAYQAIPWVSGVFYPLVTALCLLAVLAYRVGRRGGSNWWLIVSLLAAGIAPFAYESGVLAGLLVGLAEAFHRLDRSEGAAYRISWWPLAHVGLNAAYLVGWLALRQGGITTLDLTPSALAQNLTLLINGLSFPTAPLAALLGQTGLPLAAGVWLAALLTLVALLWLARRAWSAALFGLGWFVLMAGPVLVTMRFDWLLDAPRFLYPAGAGAALLWGAALSQLWNERRAARLLTVGVALGAALSGAVFAVNGVGWHLQGGMAIWDAVEAAQAEPDAPLLLVNLPDRLAPVRGFYPYFDGGAILLPPQVAAGEVAGAHLGMSRPVDHALTAGAILPSVVYLRSTYGAPADPATVQEYIDSGQRVYVADYSSSPIRLRYAGRVLPSDDRPGPMPVARFGDSITLWNASAESEGGLLRIALRWEVADGLEGGPTVFVHVVDRGGAVIAQADGDPIAGLYPLGDMAGGLIVEDVRWAVVPADEVGGVYVGVWWPDTGERLPASGGDFPDDRVPVAVDAP